MSLRIFLAFSIFCIMLSCSRAAPVILASSTPTAEAIATEEDTAEAATTTKTPTTEPPTTEPTQPPAACNMDVDLEVDRSKPILGDIPMVPDHNVQVLLLNRRFVPRKTCKELYNDGFNKSGLYIVKPCQDMSEFVVYCDMNLQGGGWTIIQRRVNNNLSFRRDYKSYQNGFGDFTENFWLGLDKLYCLTNSSGLNNELYIGLDSFIDKLYNNALYGSFSVGKEEDGYALKINQFQGENNAGDSLSINDGQKFSTYDKDQDGLDHTNCATISEGGWWYSNCGHSNLNGKYYQGGFGELRRSMVWETWLGTRYSVKTTVVAIRHKQ